MADTRAGRVAKWDHVKLFLITCVVVGHMLSVYLKKSDTARMVYYYMYLFHMPAFILISGIFSKRTINNKRYDKIFGYLVLYFFIVFLKFGVRFFLTDTTSLTLLADSGTAWYAFAMFAYFLITIFLRQFDKKYVLIMAILFGCFAGYDPDIGNFMALSRIAAFYPFFLLGYYLDAGKVLEFVRKRPVQVISVLVLLVAAVIVYRYLDQIYWTMDILKGKYAYKALDEYKRYGAVLRLGHYVVEGVLSFAVIAVIPSRECFLTFMGKRTLAIYALHWSCVDLFYKGLQGGARLRELWPEHFLVLIVAVSLLMVVVLSLKPFQDIVNFICFPKRVDQNE